MTEFKGTPGPWWMKAGDATGFKTHSGGASVLANARSDDAFFVMKIAEMATNVRESEREANAQLIAAAPDLFSELRDLVDWLEGNQRTIEGMFSMDELLAPARAALSKALAPATQPGSGE